MGDLNTTIAPNGGHDVNAVGRVVYIKNSTRPFVIAFESERYRVKSGDKVDVGERFEKFRIEDVSGQGVDQIELVVSKGDYSQSVIANAVRIVNDSGAPLPVSIDGQQLPDRPYLRSMQTFAARIGDDTKDSGRMMLINPADSGVNVIDPIANIALTEIIDNYRWQADVIRVSTNGAESVYASGRNKNLEDTSYAAPGLNVYSSTPDEWTDLIRVARVVSDRAALQFQGEHGGYFVPPGTAIGLQFSNLPSASEVDATRVKTIGSWEWIQQPVDA